jgi:hypothetical protein
MGVTCTLTSATAFQVARLCRDPAVLPVFLYNAPDAYRTTWARRLLQTKPPDDLLRGVDCMETDLDKAWHGIHFLLTASADEAPLPAGVLLANDHRIAESSYLLSPDEVAESHAFLSEVTDDELQRRYDPQLMESLAIYPGIWVRDGELGFEYLADYLQILRAILRDCADEGHGLVITVE